MNCVEACPPARVKPGAKPPRLTSSPVSVPPLVFRMLKPTYEASGPSMHGLLLSSKKFGPLKSVILTSPEPREAFLSIRSLTVDMAGVEGEADALNGDMLAAMRNNNVQIARIPDTVPDGRNLEYQLVTVLDEVFSLPCWTRVLEVKE